MVLVDTNVWIDFFKGPVRTLFLQDLLADNEVIMHPFVLGELVLGGLSNADRDLFVSISKACSFDIDLIAQFIGSRQLVGKGIGYTDTCLLYSCIVDDFQLDILTSHLSVGYEDDPNIKIQGTMPQAGR